MKDIEFRAKSKESKEWVYGYLVKGETGNYYICKNSGHAFIQVDETTIGQYTGLKDKNGTKIFEGDILKTPAWLYGEEKNCVCIYNQESNVNEIIGFGLYMINGYFSRYQDLVESDEWDEFEIIGNIYDESDVK